MILMHSVSPWTRSRLHSVISCICLCCTFVLLVFCMLPIWWNKVIYIRLNLRPNDGRRWDLIRSRRIYLYSPRSRCDRAWESHLSAVLVCVVHSAPGLRNDMRGMDVLCGTRQIAVGSEKSAVLECASGVPQARFLDRCLDRCFLVCTCRQSVMSSLNITFYTMNMQMTCNYIRFIEPRLPWWRVKMVRRECASPELH